MLSQMYVHQELDMPTLPYEGPPFAPWAPPPTYAETEGEDGDNTGDA